jgi:putative hydrolase of the HAD superfamily
VDAVLLDLYDTLVWVDNAPMFAALGERLGVDPSMLLKAFTVTRPARSVGTYGSAEGDTAAILRELGSDETEAPEITAVIRGHLVAGIRLYDDSLAALDGLQARGLRTAIVSNCDHLTRDVIEVLELEPRVDAVVLSFEAGERKPNPGIYREALAGVEAQPVDVLFVDDQARYCDGAAALGIETRLILRPDATPTEGVSAANSGHVVVHDLRTLLT